jgi:transcription initiation factor IIE alpha subunit
LSEAQVAILKVLRDLGADNDYCAVRHEELAAATHYSVRTVRRHLAAMQKDQLIAIRPRIDEAGGSLANEYIVLTKHTR